MNLPLTSRENDSIDISPKKYHGNLRYPPQSYPPPPINKALLRGYENPLVSNKGLIRALFLAGRTLDSHDFRWKPTWINNPESESRVCRQLTLP